MAKTKKVSKSKVSKKKSKQTKNTRTNLVRMRNQLTKMIDYYRKSSATNNSKIYTLKEQLRSVNKEIDNIPISKSSSKSSSNSKLTYKSKKLKPLKSKLFNIKNNKMSKKISKKKSKIDMLVAHETTPIGREYINHMNVELNSPEEVSKLQQFIKNNPEFKKQDDEFGLLFGWITLFMGDTHVWWSLLPDLIFNGVSENDIKTGKIERDKIPYKPFPRGSKTYKNDYAFFNGKHWNSQKANSTVRFDPYDKYQIKGTNQLCQTYSMMYLLNALPGELNETCSPWNGSEQDFKKYYYYTECALKFTLRIAEHCKKIKLDLEYDTPSQPYLNDLINIINYCLKYYKICINTIKLP